MIQLQYILRFLKEALTLLDDEIAIKAMKQFNLRNMRKGAHVYARYHCMELADLLMADC